MAPAVHVPLTAEGLVAAGPDHWKGFDISYSPPPFIYYLFAIIFISFKINFVFCLLNLRCWP
jgi:hypothetical protein